ncbi:MAG TPA: phage head-tail connector protein [Elusimicrobiota bacterium]|nr:phage head-tail connector protein [Elusimicrobiota bacterium]
MALDTTNALVSLAEAKTFLKISASSEDSVIEDFINRASIWANDYTGRRLKSRSNSDVYDGDGSDILLLRDYPVNAVTLFQIVDEPVPLIIYEDFSLNAENGIIKTKNGRMITKGFQNVTITYTAGYSTPPETIKEAVLLYVGHLYRRQYADQKFGVQSETVGDRTTTYGSDDIIPKAKALLNPYRSERVLFSGF